MKFLSRFKRKASAEPSPAPAQPAPLAFTPELKSMPPVAPPKTRGPDELVLELGDFLHRLPAELLVPGPHDLHAEMRFEIAELSRRINKGQTTIALSEIYKRCPHIFRREITEKDDTEIRFPWQKLAKLVSLARPADGAAPADPTVESLAQKLRASRAKGGAPGAIAPATTPKAAAPVLPGRGGNRTSWFSRPTVEKPADMAPRPQPEPLKASIPATPFESTPIAQPVTPAETPAKTAAEDFRLADLPPEIQRRIAVFKGDYERQIAELDRQRRATAEARDRIATDLEKLRRDLEKAQGDIGAEATATAVSRELLQKATAERDTLQAEMQVLKKEVAEIRDQSRVAELIAERDALLQQKAYLASQVAEVVKKGGGGSGPANAGASIQAQRQVEDYQRRIAAMEAHQREAAQQLVREKEARAKAEKLLAAADKLQEESANYMESTKAEIRKEVEASARLRESEFRKIQKELQEQLTAFANENRRAAAELESAHVHIAELEANLATGAAVPSASDPMQAQFVTQLEADIESYRDRLKILLRERDEARAQAEEKSAGDPTIALRSQLAERETALETLRGELAAVRQRAEEDQATLEARGASLLSAVEGARQSFTEKREGLEPALAEARSRFDAAEKETATLRAQLDDLRAQFQGEQAANLREQSVALEQQLAGLVRERDELRAQAATAATELKSKLAAHEELISHLEKDHTSVLRANEDLTRRLAGSEQALVKLESSRTSFEGGAAMLGDAALQTEITQLRLELEQARRSLDEAEQAARARVQALQENEAAFARLVTEQQRDALALSEERANAARLAKQAADEQSRSARLAEHLAAAEAALADLRDQQLAVRTQGSTAADRQQTALAELEKSAAEMRTALIQERDQARSERDAVSAHLLEREAALQTLEQKFRDAETQHTGEIARLTAQIQSVRAEAERARLADDTAAGPRLRQDVESLRAELQQAQAARAELASALDQARAEAGRLSGWERKLADAETARAEAIRKLERGQQDSVAARRELEDAHASVVTELAGLHRELANSRLERDNLARQRDELLRRLSRTTEEPRVLDEPGPAHDRHEQLSPTPTVIEVEPEVFTQEPERAVNLPRIRPVPVPPPRVGNM
jgi:chromosome segregation ATPase